MLLYILLYWLILSLISFFQFVIDKNRARKGLWRISEKTLLITALTGGAPGALLGMHTARHKTKHWYFKFGIPVLCFLQIALFTCLAFYFSSTLFTR